jgi:hypothetical protein
VLSPSPEVERIEIRDSGGQVIPFERRIEGEKWFLRLEL